MMNKANETNSLSIERFDADQPQQEQIKTNSHTQINVRYYGKLQPLFLNMLPTWHKNGYFVQQPK